MDFDLPRKFVGSARISHSRLFRIRLTRLLRVPQSDQNLPLTAKYPLKKALFWHGIAAAKQMFASLEKDNSAPRKKLNTNTKYGLSYPLPDHAFT